MHSMALQIDGAGKSALALRADKGTHFIVAQRDVLPQSPLLLKLVGAELALIRGRSVHALRVPPQMVLLVEAERASGVFASEPLLLFMRQQMPLQMVPPLVRLCTFLAQVAVKGPIVGMFARNVALEFGQMIEDSRALGTRLLQTLLCHGPLALGMTKNPDKTFNKTQLSTHSLTRTWNLRRSLVQWQSHNRRMHFHLVSDLGLRPSDEPLRFCFLTCP